MDVMQHAGEDDVLPNGASAAVFKRPAGSIEWSTPSEIIEAVYAFFEGPPDLDPADNDLSVMQAKVSIRLPKDGIAIRWRAKSRKQLKVWVNSPFGSWLQHIETRVCMTDKEFKEWLEAELGHKPSKAELAAERENWERHDLSEWVEKCRDEALGEEDPKPLILQILPACVETRHFQDIIFKDAAGVCFVKGRTCYVPPEGVTASTPPMGSAIICWGELDEDSRSRFLSVFQPLGACMAKPA